MRRRALTAGVLRGVIDHRFDDAFEVADEPEFKAMLQESLSSSCLEIIPVSAEQSDNISFLVSRLREMVEKHR